MTIETASVDQIRPGPAGKTSRDPGHSRWQFLQNLIASYGFYFSGYLLSFLVVPYLARVLGPSRWGLFALTQTFAMYIILVVDCGFAFSATKLVARNRDRPEALSNILAGVLSAKAILALFSVVVAFAATRVAPAYRHSPLLFWSGIAWGVLQGANMNWYYQGLERMRSAAIVDISIKTASVLLTIVLVRTPERAWLALALNATACLISLTILLIVAYRDIPLQWPTWGATLTNLRTGVHAFLPRNSFLVSSLSGVFILGFFAQTEILGHYAGAERISRAVMGLLVPLTDALYARINRIMHTAPDSFFDFARRLLLAMGGCGVLMGAAVFLSAPTVVRIVLGPAFGPAVLTLRIFSLLGPAIAVGNTLGAHWMLSLGLDRRFGHISLSSALFTVALCPFVAHRFGANGTASLIVASQVLIAVMAFVAVRRHRVSARQSQSVPPPESSRISALPQAADSPEWRLLFAIARGRTDPTAKVAIEQLARAPLDWNILLDSAREHGVLPLLHHHLMAVCPDAVPAKVARVLTAEVIRTATRNVFMTAELAGLVSILEQNGIPVIPFKGPILADMVYGDISLRSFSDLDVLVSVENLHRARKVLTAAGYQAEFSEEAQENKYINRAEKVIRFFKRSGPVVIEMHWEFAPRNMGFPTCATPELWARCRETSFGGKVMRVLSPEDVILNLCFHGAKHCWDKLEWICCLAELIRTRENLDWQWIQSYAHSCASERILHLGLALTRSLAGELPLPIRSLALSPASEKLAEVVLRNMVLRTREDTRKAPYRYWFYWRAKDRFGDRIRLLFLASGQTLRPRELRRFNRTPRLDRLLTDTIHNRTE